MTTPEDPDMRMFRHHHAAPEGVASALYRGLTREWADLHASPGTTAAVRRWSRSQPALTGLDTPGAVVDAIDDGGPQRADELLLALVELFQAGHQLAGRTALQALLPCLAKKAGNAGRLCSGSDDTWAEDRRHLTVAEFWEVMARYPADRRRSSVAGNLVLETLRRITGPRDQDPALPVDPHRVAEVLDSRGARGCAARLAGDLGDLGDLGDEPGSDERLLQVIAWGMRNGTISREEAQLLVEVYMPRHTTTESGVDVAAAGRGMTKAAVRQRCSRASRRLAAAVRDLDGAAVRGAEARAAVPA